MVWAWYFPEDSKGRLEAIFFNIVVKQKRQLGDGDFYKINFAEVLKIKET